MSRLAYLTFLAGSWGCSGCDCDNEGGGRVPSVDSGHDASRDAEQDRHEVDSATDATLDATVDSGSCPEGETPVETFAILHEGDGAPCGDRCRQVTWASRGIHGYDVKGTSLTYVSADDITLGFVDLTTGVETGFLIARPGEERVGTYGPVAVEGTTIVYSSYPTDDSKRGWLWRVDLTSRCRKRLREFQSPGADSIDIARDLDLDGGRIVWDDERLGIGRQDIFAYDLATGVETQLTSYGCCAAVPRIWGDRVAFNGWADGPYGILSLDLPDGEPVRVWSDAHEQALPALQGDRVVFTYEGDEPVGRLDIHGVDLGTGEHFVVTDHEGDQCWPDVFGDLIIWRDLRANPRESCQGSGIEDSDIYGLDLSTGNELQITTLPGNESSPRIWDRTVYFRYRAPEADDFSQVYAQELPQ